MLWVIVLRDLFWITSFAAPKFVSVKIGDDAINPGEEGGPRLEAAPGPIDAHKGLLGEVPRVRFVARQAIGKVIGRLAVSLDGMLQELPLVHGRGRSFLALQRRARP